MNKRHLNPALNFEKRLHTMPQKSALFRIVSFLIFSIALCGISFEGWGQVSITSTGTAFTQNFDVMGTSGTATLPTGFKIGTDWSSGTTATTLAYGSTGTGVVTGTSSGGVINWANGITGSSTERSLGFLNTGSFTSPKSIVYAFTNNTGSTITSLVIAFNYEKTRSGSRQFDWNFFHGSTSAPSISASNGDQSYAADGNNNTISNPPTTLSKTVNISSLSIANGSTYYLKWTFTGLGGSSNGQGIGIDDFSITANGSVTPTITVSPSSLSGFTYVFGSGPSSEQSFTISGSNLTANISLAPPTNYEISTGTGGSFSATNPVILTPSGGTVSNNTIYVRLKSGLSAGSYNTENILATSTGATPQNVVCSGTVTAVTPTITATPSSLTGFTYVLGGGPSGVQNFVLTGTSLTGADVTLTPSTNYEISTSNSPFTATNPITLTAYDGTSTIIYVRLKSGLAVNSYNGETITIAGGGATTVNVTCNGNVTTASGSCFSEDFSSIATGDNTTTTGSGTAWSGNSNFPTVINAYQAGGAVKLGTSTNAGSITSASLTSVSGDVTVSFEVKGWTTVEGDIKVTLNGLTQTVTYTAIMTDPFENKSVIFTSVPSGSTLKIETSAKRAFIDNVILTCAAACTPPSTQATSMTFSSVGTTTMTVGWTRGTIPGDAVLAVGKSGSVASNPIIGTAYSGNSTFGSGTPCGGGSAVFNSSGTSVSVINLIAETQYYFNAYEYFSATNCYAIPALTGNRYTLSVEPTSQPTSGLSATTCATNSIDLTVPAPSAGADGYIVLQKSGSAPTGLPADAIAYAVGNTIGDATVAAIVTSSGTITISGLSASTNYYFLLIPYNANSALVAQTYNYLTSGTFLQTSFTTLSASASAASTVETDGTYAYTQNIAYTTYQATPVPASAANSVGVHNIIIKDGGATTDADLLPTILTAISYTYTGTSNTIRAAALFTTTGSKVADGTIGSNSISFSGLTGANVTASDGGTVQLILRVTFNTAVTDNDKLVFTVSSVSGGNACNYSQFASSNGGGAQSDNNSGNDKNRIEVTADRLIFGQQPTTTIINSAMAPAVTLKGVDVNNNTDLDYSGTVSITSTGTLTGSPVSTSALSGVATFSSLTHTAAGTGFVLTASTSGLAYSNTIISSPFDITDVVYVTGDYRSTGSGTWANGGASTLWERYNSGTGWSSGVNAPLYNISNSIFIQNGHTITTGGSFGTSVKLKIMDGGVFNCNHSSTAGSAYIYAGGTLNINASFSMASGGNFEVEDNGNVNINFAYGTPATSIWAGIEIFHPNSNLVLQDWDGANDRLIPDNTSISTNTYNGYTAAFGNIICDFGSNLGSSDNMVFLESGVNINMAHGDLIFRSNSTSGADMRISTTGTVISGIGGDFIVENSYSGSQVINMKTSGKLDFTIKGNMQLDAATTRIQAGSIVTTNLYIDGDLNITPSAVLEFNSTIATDPVSTLNLKGDLTVAASGLLQNTNDKNLGRFNFVGAGDGLTDATTQTIDIASTSGNENRYITFSVKNGAYVKQINRDFELGTNSRLIVENGGTYDFGFDGTTALNLAISGSQAGTVFNLQQGGILKITSPDGITTTDGIGNVRTVASNRTYDQVATFWYIGKEYQLTGNALSTSSTGKQVIVELASNSLKLRPSNCLAFSNNTTISATGGKLDIRKGQFIESETEYITACSGTLYMSPGTLYKIVKGNNAYTGADDIPRMSGVGAGSFPYVLTGGTIELAGSGANNAFQRLRSDNASYNYVKVKFSGSNTYLSDYKNISSQTEIDSALIITGTAVVDCFTGGAGVAASFIGNGGLIMDGGRLRIKKLNNANPELSGINMPYLLTGGTIEFYGSGATQQQLIRGTYGSPSTKISFYNIDINASAANYADGDPGNVNMSSSFLLKGALNVFSPAVFRMDATDIIDDAASPSNSITINSGAGLLYGNIYGIKTSGTGESDGNIRISGSRSFSNDASYGFISNGNMASGNGLPASVNGLYVYKANSGDMVTLTNTVRASNLLKMLKGNIITGTNMVELGISAAQTGTLNYTEGYVVGNMRRWFNGVNSGIASGLFPLGENISGSLKNRKYLIEFSSPPIDGGFLDVYFKNEYMGYGGLPISGIPAAGACVNSFDVTTTEDQGYWVATPESGKLSDGTYKLSITGEGFVTITDLCKLTLLKRVGAGNWLAPGTHLEPTGTTSVPTVSRSGMTGFSNFGFGGGQENPLPIELLDFTAYESNGIVKLEWTTASETNNDYFNVERSADAANFVSIAKIKGAGNSNTPIHYNTIDSKPLQDINYYRLKQTDYDGELSYSKILAVDMSGSLTLKMIYVNASCESGNVKVAMEAEAGQKLRFEFYDVLGTLLLKKEMPVSSANPVFDFYLPGLHHSLYLLKVCNNSNCLTNKFYAE